MSECCDRPGYQTIFNDRLARRIVRSYRKRGLNETQLRMVSFLTARGIQDASVLEIGGGVGDLQVELLRRGARAATNLEISAGYEAEAASLLKQSGMADRVTRRLLDIATAPEEVEAADVVVLHRVVCCYPDYQRLLAAAASHARRLPGLLPSTEEPVQQGTPQLRKRPASASGQRVSRIRPPARRNDRRG
ncbi:MAG TPA: class I SAM-dependent methyltransferase [Propionibacteriaceae bacterium]|jgi:2-polyprenyl-3-methyl-5-hydroxy-6-metoxy-1,4-benzoquinol methylase|nr:class I SAM-dependent methyltransferase [Propionibacteriaceae bacterium]